MGAFKNLQVYIYEEYKKHGDVDEIAKACGIPSTTVSRGINQGYTEFARDANRDQMMSEGDSLVKSVIDYYEKGLKPSAIAGLLKVSQLRVNAIIDWYDGFDD